jgi:hypothetical protein
VKRTGRTEEERIGQNAGDQNRRGENMIGQVRRRYDRR